MFFFMQALLPYFFIKVIVVVLSVKQEIDIRPACAPSTYRLNR